MVFPSASSVRFSTDTLPPSPARSVPDSPFPSSSQASAAGTPGLLGRIMERKRAALGDLSNQAELEPPVPAVRRTRARLEHLGPSPSREDDVAVQRFTLVSRGAPPAKRAPPKQSVLVAPPSVAAQLGAEVQVCRCSECDRTGLRRRMSGTRLCRRDTESHPEYALLLCMSERFESECIERSDATELATEACCREKTAYFILGPGATTVGYVAAEIEANRRVKQNGASDAGGELVNDNVPIIIQLYVEPEFRRRGYARSALKLLMRDHESVRVDDPTPVVAKMLSFLGFTSSHTQEGQYGRPIVTFVRAFMDDAP